MSKRPSNDAARSGVDEVFVVWLTSAPASTSNLTTFRWPAPTKDSFNF